MEEQYTEEQLLAMLGRNFIGVDIAMDEKRDLVLFKELKAVEGLVEYLRETAARDIQRYFEAATKEEQLMIRGTYARTMYFMNMVKNEGRKNTKIEEVNYR